jgi:hypothetical protein
MAIDKNGTAKKRSGVARYSPEGTLLLFDGAPDGDVPPPTHAAPPARADAARHDDPVP